MALSSSTLLGGAFLVGGLLGAVGSITGRLPVEIAALFYPDLTTAPQASGPPAGSLQSGILWLKTHVFNKTPPAKTHNPGTALGR